MPQIQLLEPVVLREVWGSVGQEFVPWLADNLHLLEKELGLNLEQVEVVSRGPGVGDDDIIAQQVRTGAKVVFTTQSGYSNDYHCVNLLRYSAGEDGNILVWVAEAFTPYHRRVLSWLNQSDNVDVYAVEVKAYRLGDTLGVNFQLVEAPIPQVNAPYDESDMTVYYGYFYRPLVEQLHRSLFYPVGRGGWRGRWRSFQSGDPEAIYATGFRGEEGLGVVRFARGGPPTGLSGATPIQGGDRLQTERQYRVA